MKPDMLLIRVERLCQEQVGDSQHLRALSSWAAWSRELLWSGDWAGLDLALQSLAALYGELVLEDGPFAVVR